MTAKAVRGYWVTCTGQLITTFEEPTRWEKFWRCLLLDEYWERCDG